MGRRSKPFKETDPDIVEKLLEHLAQGWSIGMFRKKLSYGHEAYYRLVRTNPRFAAVNDFYKKKPDNSWSIQSHYVRTLRKKQVLD